MGGETLLSVGIDIGTSTTQTVFSRIVLSNTAPAFSIPRIQITEKTVLFRAPICLTPLLRPDTIDAEGVRALVADAYRQAGVRPAEIGCGAVIITGETARKQNARAVLEALSGFAGDFVVATAGPRLEAVLAGRGAGAAAMSEEKGRSVLNLDIGGGTTNLCLFRRGEAEQAACLDVGGRLLRFEPGSLRVWDFTEAMSRIARDAGVRLAPGETLTQAQAEALADRMAGVLLESVGLRPRTPLHDALCVGEALPEGCEADIYTFSGGVGACVYGEGTDDAAFSDIGAELGRSLARSEFFTRGRVMRPPETHSATVIGAGAYSVEVSGSTVCYRNVTLPMKNLPVGVVRMRDAEDMNGLRARVLEQISLHDGLCAIGFEGIRAPDYATVLRLAEELGEAMTALPVKVVIMERDMAKALGQALLRRWGPDASVLCIDGIHLRYGDTVDIGVPLSEGRVLPVVVKTLAFASGEDGKP